MNWYIDTLQFAKIDDLANLNSDVDENIDELKKVRSCLNTLKSKVDKLDVDQLKTASVDLINIIDVVDKGIVKKNVNDELVKQSNAFDSNEIIKKTVQC